jgi:hypothetical protein
MISIINRPCLDEFGRLIISPPTTTTNSNENNFVTSCKFIINKALKGRGQQNDEGRKTESVDAKGAAAMAAK